MAVAIVPRLLVAVIAAWRDQAVEAAIVFPVLIALLLGTIEFSFVLYTNNALQTAAREVARHVLEAFRLARPSVPPP